MTNIAPTKEQALAFADLPDDHPIDMMNFIKFREFAEYPKGSGFEDKNWTGAQSYAEYGRLVGPIARELGRSTIAYSAQPEMTMIGPAQENWDQIFVVRYESAAAFLAFTSSDEYRKHSFHRTAALADSRLYRLNPANTYTSVDD